MLPMHSIRNAQSFKMESDAYLNAYLYMCNNAIAIDFLRHTLIPIYGDMEAKKYFSTHHFIC